MEWRLVKIEDGSDFDVEVAYQNFRQGLDRPVPKL